MSPSVHPTAIVDTGVRLAEGVVVGPHAILDGDIVIGAGTRIEGLACLHGPLEIGPDCVVAHGASVGHDPQLKIPSPPYGRTRLGRGVVVRENAQINCAMSPDQETIVGDGCLIMGGAHVAHDCVLVEHVVLCNHALLAGHVHVGARAFVSGNCVVHQFCRIGELAIIGGLSAIVRDVPPFSMVVGQRPAMLEGLNTIGLRRAGIAPEARRELRQAYQILFRSRSPLPERLELLAEQAFVTPEVDRLEQFVRSTERGVIGFGGRRVGSPEEDESDVIPYVQPQGRAGSRPSEVPKSPSPSRQVNFGA